MPGKYYSCVISNLFIYFQFIMNVAGAAASALSGRTHNVPKYSTRNETLWGNYASKRLNAEAAGENFPCFQENFPTHNTPDSNHGNTGRPVLLQGLQALSSGALPGVFGILYHLSTHNLETE